MQTMSILFAKTTKKVSGVLIKRIRLERDDLEQGTGSLEYVATLPVYILLIALFAIAALVFWTQGMADAVTVMSIREATFNRGGDLVLVPAGAGYFGENLPQLVGSSGVEAVGSPQAAHLSNFRMVTLNFTSLFGIDFAGITSNYNFAGGAAGRYWIFYPGPPDPWE